MTLERGGVGQKTRCGCVGSALDLAEGHSQNDFCHLLRVNRVVARVHKESTKDAEAGSHSGKAQTELIEVVVMGRRNFGSSFDEFFTEDNLPEEATAVAIKRVVAHQLATLMESQGLTKAELARRMDTSRAALDRLLDPENWSATPQTLQSAAAEPGC